MHYLVHSVVEVYTAPTSVGLKEDILEAFGQDTSLRILVATVAFGMGIDYPDIRQVVNFGVQDKCQVLTWYCSGSISALDHVHGITGAVTSPV